MHLIKLDATDSTNTYLHDLLPFDEVVDYTVVRAVSQLRGRGQRGTTWQSEAGKNLTFSLLRKDLNLPIHNAFVLNICVSLAVYSVLKKLEVPALSIKWPNDILSGTSKIGGILVENKISGRLITNSIIGIGLNVNQLSFDKLSNVSSLQLLLDTRFDLDGLLFKIVGEVRTLFLNREEKGDAFLRDAYDKVLFRKGILSSFEDDQGNPFKGSVNGVSQEGKLRVSIQDGIMKEFDLKEIRFLL